MVKISIIVPMYNAENTIEECLDSLIAQTIIDDIELIIVDDHSTDSCSGIVEEYERKHPDKIILVRLDVNCGPGNARNVAMDYATGEYIGYVDADDAVFPEMYEKMFDIAVSTQADLVDAGYYDQADDKAILFTSDDLTGRLNDDKRSRLIISGGYIWCKIYRKEFLVSEGIKFRNEYTLEDMDYLIECFSKAEIISNVKETLYVYRNRPGSLSKTDAFEKYIYNQLSTMKSIYERTAGLEYYSGIKSAVEFAMLHLYSNVLVACMNALRYNSWPDDYVFSILSSAKTLKDIVITGGYNNPYVNKGISDKNIGLIKANDISKEAFTKFIAE